MPWEWEVAVGARDPEPPAKDLAGRSSHGAGRTDEILRSADGVERAPTPDPHSHSPTAAPTIRRAGRADAAALAALAARLFAETYGPTHPEPELGRYLAGSFSADALRAVLADPAACVLLVESGAAAIGYAQLRAQSPAPAPGVVGQRPLEIARFYVDARWHGRGVAGALMAAVRADARDRGADVVWLAVWQEAARPQAFYRREGFGVVGTTTFDFGDRRDDDFVMAWPVTPRPAGAA